MCWTQWHCAKGFPSAFISFFSIIVKMFYRFNHVMTVTECQRVKSAEERRDSFRGTRKTLFEGPSQRGYRCYPHVCLLRTIFPGLKWRKHGADSLHLGWHRSPTVVLCHSRPVDCTLSRGSADICFWTTYVTDSSDQCVWSFCCSEIRK
jgi:hypothetical protein